MIMIQVMSIALAFVIILLLVVEKAKRRYFQLTDAVKLIRERNRKFQSDLEDIFGIYEGVRDATSTLKIDEILQEMAHMVHKFFEFSSASLYLFNEKDNKVFINLEYDFFLRSAIRDEVELEDVNIKEVMVQKRAKISPTENEMKHLAEENDIPDIYIIVPLIVEKKVTGVIKMAREAEPLMPFTPDDLHKLSILCAQTSVILRRARLYAEVERLSIMDGLTGLYVHRYFQERLVSESERAQRHNEPFFLIMADIDYFKRYNDEYGHLAGDELLRRVSAALKEGVRDTDIVSRYGGEEFTIILIHRTKEEVMKAAEEIRKKVASIKMELEEGSTGVTISIGVAGFPEDAAVADKLLNCADEALYKAKGGGRNRVVAYKK